MCERIRAGRPCGVSNWAKRWKCVKCQQPKPWTTELELSYLLSKLLWDRFENRLWGCSIPHAAHELGCQPEQVLQLVRTQGRGDSRRYLLFQGAPDHFFVVLAKWQLAKDAPPGMSLIMV